jgi:hypothetical protein
MKGMTDAMKPMEITLEGDDEKYCRPVDPMTVMKPYDEKYCW